nr:uncharacterized protein LOC113729387 [Coffea arabica]
MASNNFTSRIISGASASSSTWSRTPMSSLKLAGLDIAIKEKKSDDIEKKEWSTINRLVCKSIRSYLSREQKYAFKNEISAWKLWRALEKKFLKKRGQNKLLMKKRLFRFDYQSGTTMNEHITIFNQLVADLLNLDVKFEDEDLVLMLLSSFPNEFEHLEITLLHVKENVSLDAKDCLKLKKKGKAPQDVNVTECKSDAKSGFSLAVSPLTSHPNEWILDSGCTYHMSPMREWFFEFKELDSGVVYMKNDNPYKTVGIGSIKLRNHDGSIRILKDVRYVPNLKKNLISLGVLESKGLIVTMRDEIFKTTSRALVMLKGVRKNNLYYYQGSTVVGTAGAATSFSSKKDAETTKLWHM